MRASPRSHRPPAGAGAGRRSKVCEVSQRRVRRGVGVAASIGRTSRSKLINTITRSAAGLQRLRCGSGGICRWHSEMLLSYGGEWMVIATMREIELAARGGIARHPPLEGSQPPTAALHTRPNSLLAHTPRANSASLRLSLSRTPRQRAPRRAIPRSTHTVVRGLHPVHPARTRFASECGTAMNLNTA